MDVKTYLIMTGLLAAAYTGYTILNKPKHSLIPKDLTQRISQEIKHQMMIVCINYSKAMKKIRQDNKDKFAAKANELLQQFRSQLSQVYLSKENLILRKYSVSRETYGKSLEKFKNDKAIGKNITQIFDMMERALEGKLPDFTVPKQANNAFSKQRLGQIYKEMVTLIGKKVTLKLQEECAKNSKFNPASDDDFRNAIRELSIYDIKVNFLKEKGFNVQWGCPNEIFFKALENQKSKDEQYEKKIVAYQKTYEKVIEIVSNDPKSLNDKQIDQMFANALNQSVPAKPVVNPVLSTVTPSVRPTQATIVPPVAKKVQPVVKQIDEVDLEKLMMQQLLNRSQQAPEVEQKSQVAAEQQSAEVEVEVQNEQQQQIIHPEKVGLTEEEVNEEGQVQVVNKPKEQATEQVQVAENNQQFVEKQQEIFETIVNEVEQNQQEKQEKPEEKVEQNQNENQQSQKVQQDEQPAVINEESPVESPVEVQKPAEQDQ